MADHTLLRQIPKMDELLAHPDMAGIQTPALAAQAAREVLGQLRESILAGTCKEVPDKDRLAAEVSKLTARKNLPSLRRVINATGVILHTNLGRAPLATSAQDAVTRVAAGYSTLEYNPEHGGRGDRFSHVSGLLTRLTGAEDALVVNNNAAAVLLMLAALAKGREVIVSRGELVEIGGSFRIPEVMEQSGCTLREVGATNRTRMSDYQKAIGEHTGALLKAHTSNYKILGFTQEVKPAELATLAAEHDLPFLYDLGSGSMINLGLPDEPSVDACISAGADVVCFSGDKLLGGPQAGIIVGKKRYLSAMKKHPLARALRIDKLTLAALEATLRLYLDPDLARREIPTLRMLFAPLESLREAAEKLVGLLVPAGDQVALLEDEGQVGGGSAPTQTLPGWVVAVNPRDISVDALERRLRGVNPAIVARIAKDRLIIDPRAVDESDYGYIAGRLLAALTGEGEG
ncbi:MAG: L-seryl-tRNA(Sec) selenium transferase [Oscillospiraceae bacterium]|nr:L-seryl-tRNA(Sec) selenium transferase [Oscillospiraceae bacterium]